MNQGHTPPELDSEAAQRAREYEGRAKRGRARLMWFTCPIGCISGAALVAIPFMLFAAATERTPLLIVSAIIAVGGALLSGGYGIAYGITRQQERHARYERAGVRAPSRLGQSLASIALIISCGLLIFAPDLARWIVASLFGVAPGPAIVACWLLVVGIGVPLLIAPVVYLLEKEFQAGLETLPAGSSIRGAAVRRGLIAAAVLMVVGWLRFLAQLL